MKIHVRYFASLREALGRSKETREAPEGATPASVLRDALGEAHARRAAAVAFAVNREHAPGDRPLRDGDEVAFLPPVSGG